MTLNSPEYYRDEQARQVDVRLRARFPHLLTRIFANTAHSYVIVFDKKLEDASAIAPEFDHSIRLASLSVALSNEAPVNFLRELRPITDEEVAGTLAGLPLRRFDIVNLLSAKFPELPVVDVTNDSQQAVIHLSSDIGDDARKQLLTFAGSLGQSMPFGVAVDPKWSGTVPAVPGADPMVIVASRLRRHAPAFTRRDEQFWFDNMASIADGRLDRDAFPGMHQHDSRCFVDATMASAHVNLRQLLMLYDVVFLSPPLAHLQEKFLTSQGLNRQDLLACVASGRLKLVMTQPEERLDLTLLEEIAEVGDETILGRRTTGGLLLASVVDAAQDYRLSDERFFSPIKDLSEAIAPLLLLDPDDAIRSMLWPLMARREGLLRLLDKGSKGGPAVSLAQLLAKRLNALQNVDLQLETMVLSERVHVAHALGATAFPAIDEPEGFQTLMAAIGAELNFYQSFNRRIAASWAGDQQRRMNGVTIAPPIPLFEFDASVPIGEFLSESSWCSTKKAGRALFTRLAEMPVDSRQAEIDRLKSEMRAKGRWHSSKLISFDNADTAIAISSMFFSFLYPPIAGLKNLALPLVEAMRRAPKVDAAINRLTEDRLALFGGNQDLEFLSRVDRVASFTTKRVH